MGDENGILKLAKNNSKDDQYTSHGEQSRERGIQGLNWLGSARYFSVLRRDKTVEIWNAGRRDTIQRVVSSSIDVDDPVNSILVKSEEANTVVCYGETGKVAIVKVHGTSMDTITTSCCDLAVNLSAGSTCFGGVVFGGKESDAVLYDLETMQGVWHAENVPNDKLDLRVPIWITDIAFLDPERDSISTGAKFATGTGYKHVRLYDTNKSAQPIVSLDVGEFRVTRIQRSKSDHSIYVADTAGGFCLWDLRMRRKLFTLKGCAGSIRDIAIDNTSDHVACVGLDRFLHVYSTATNKVKSTVYLKSRLNRCILMETEIVSSHRRLKTGKAGKGVRVNEGKIKRSRESASQIYDSNEDILESYADSSDEEEYASSDDDDDNSVIISDDDGSDDGSPDDQDDENDESEEEEIEDHHGDASEGGESGSDEFQDDEADDGEQDEDDDDDNEDAEDDDSDDHVDDEEDEESDARVYSKDGGVTFIPVTSRRARVGQATMQQRRQPNIEDNSKRKHSQPVAKAKNIASGHKGSIAPKKRKR